jgi:hypothetical protein
LSGRDRGCGRAGPVVVDRGLVVQRRVATLTVVEHLDPFKHRVGELGPGQRPVEWCISVSPSMSVFMLGGLELERDVLIEVGRSHGSR